MSQPNPVLTPPVLPDVADIRLIVSDLDGSLLGEDGEVPADFWPVLDELERRGISFCPASGRQCANMRERFGDRGKDFIYISENGAYVAQGTEDVLVNPLPDGMAQQAVERVHGLAGAGRAAGVVLCGKRAAYVEPMSDGFAEQVHRHYADVVVLEDLTAVRDVVLKVAVFDFESVEDAAAPAFADLSGADSPVRVLVSGQHWLDVMSPEADKGHALRVVQQRLDVGAEHTMAFGDYLNDSGLMGAARWSVAMDNAHPLLRAQARYIAPSNTRGGVTRTIAAALGMS